MPRNTIFISYPLEDFRIAGSINSAVISMPQNQMDVFLDKEKMTAGQRIPDTIQTGLRETIYFVAVATNVSRRNFDWCGRELGFYQGSYDDRPDDRRETCLFHLTYPELFAETHNFKLQSLRPEHRDQFIDNVVATTDSNVYSFLMGLAELNAQLHPPANPAAYWQVMPGWAERSAIAITDAFFDALQTRVENTWYPQGRIQLSIANGDFYKDLPAEIPNDAEVELSGSMYNIFGFSIPDVIKPVLWDKFKQFLKDSSGSDILATIVADIAISALPSRADAKGDYIHQAPNQIFYRVLLVKHSVYGNKRREMVFNLIKTLDKVQGGSKDTTTLVAGIVLGSKYRSLFVEANARYDIKHISTLDLESTSKEITQMLKDIERISADAASDGLADYTALVGLLGETQETRDLFDRWWKVFPPMESGAKKFVKNPTQENKDHFLEAYAPFVETSRRNNGAFLLLCLDAYRKTLKL